MSRIMTDAFLEKHLKLIPSLIMQYKTPDHISIGSDKDIPGSLVFHKDILMILPDFFDWNHVDSFLSSIQVGQEQVLDVIKDLYNAGILEEKVENTMPEASLTQEKHLPESLSKQESIYFNIHNHHLMVKDYVRADAYRRAIESAVSPEDVVLELGCGSGILTMFAAKAGAKKLYAIEINENMVNQVTRPLIEENGFDDRVTFLIGNSMNIKTEAVEPKADVFIAEILGDGVFNENILTYTIDARERFLKKDAKMLPQGLDVYIFAYEDPLNKSIVETTDLKLITAARSSVSESLYLKYDTYNSIMLSKHAKALYIDLTTVTDPTFVAKGELEIITPGKLNGCCLYFTAHIDEETRLSNSPWNPQISWSQQLFNIHSAKSYKKGAKISYTLTYDGFLNLTLED